MNSFFVFILNVFINSFLMFATVVALVEIVIFLFRIQPGRFTSLLRMIPIVKLPFDLFFYDFSRWSYLKGINPIAAEEGSRTLSAMLGWPNSISEPFFLPITSGIQLTVNNMTFTVADVISYSINPITLNIACSLILFISGCLFVKTVFDYLWFIHHIEDGKEYANKKIRNLLISKFLRKTGAQIVSSPFSTSPFVCGLFSTEIYIPEALCKTLSKKEYEAVLAHEIEHIRYKDNLIRLVLTLISSIFWWIPTKWLRSHIEEGQEIGCDFRCKDYGVDPIALATAIYKSAKFSLKGPENEFTHSLAKHLICKRTDLLLKTNLNKFGKIRSLVYCLAAAIAFFMIFLGRYWIF